MESAKENGTELTMQELKVTCLHSKITWVGGGGVQTYAGEKPDAQKGIQSRVGALTHAVQKHTNSDACAMCANIHTVTHIEEQIWQHKC